MHDVVTHEQALIAVDDMDDYARMTVGIDPVGARTTLLRYIHQQSGGLVEFGPDPPIQMPPHAQLEWGSSEPKADAPDQDVSQAKGTE